MATSVFRNKVTSAVSLCVSSIPCRLVYNNKYKRSRSIKYVGFTPSLRRQITIKASVQAAFPGRTVNVHQVYNTGYGANGGLIINVANEVA